MLSTCPTDTELTALLAGDLPPTGREPLERHLETCDACRQRLEAMAVGDGMWLGEARAYLRAGSPSRVREALDHFQSPSGATLAIKVLAPDPILSGSEAAGRLGEYEILGELGRGGMGVVFKARQRKLQRNVALKVILAGQLASEAQVRRFHLEAEAAARLDHPNIVPIYEVGECDGRHFFSMKLIDGASLKDTRPTFQAPPSGADTSARDLARLMADVARAVHHAHQHGVLHRDLKPGNVLIDPQGRPHLTDFGLAKVSESDANLTLSHAVMGTPAYMSPEQAAGRTKLITTASDVYSLGAILYELLTGRPPFEADDAMLLLNKVVNEEPKSPRSINPAIPRDLEIVCLKCLEKEPSRRPHSAELFAEELERYSRGEAIRSRPVSALEKLWRWCRRKPAMAAALGGLVLVFILGFAGVAWKWKGEIKQRQRAEQQTGQTQRALTRLEIERAEAQFNMGNPDKGLAYLARLVRQNRSNQVAVERLMNALACRHFCLPIAPLTHDVPLKPPADPRRSIQVKPPSLGAEVSVATAAFSPDGRLAATASLDGTVRLWDSLNGHPFGSPLLHDDAVLWAQFSRDGERLVTTTRNGFARIWNVQTQRLISRSHRFPGAIRYASFNPDATKVVVACNETAPNRPRQGSARVLDVATGGTSGQELQHLNPVYVADFSPDGQCILTAEERPSSGKPPGHIWDTDTRQEIGHFLHWYRPELRNPFPCFSPSGDRVLSFDDRFNALLFSARQSAPRPVPLHRFHSDDRITALAFSPDGRFVATGARDSTARVWSAETGARSSLFLHRQSLNSVQFSPDGRLLLTGSNDRTARLWRLNEEDQLQAPFEPLRHASSVLDAVMTTNRILTISETNTAWLWEVSSGPLPLVLLPRESAGVERVCFSADGTMLASLDHNGVHRWNPRTGESIGGLFYPRQGGQTMVDLDISSDEKYLATALDGGNVLLWNPRATNLEAAPLFLPFVKPAAGRGFRPNPAQAVRRVRFSPDTQTSRFVAACDDGTATLWSINRERALHTLHHEGRVNYAEFSPDGKRVVTASWDQTAKVWDAETGEPLFTLPHDAQVNWARFDPSGTRIVTASRDKTVRIWSAQEGTLLHTLGHADIPPESYAFDFGAGDEGTRLATIAGDTLRIWDLDTGEPVAEPIRHPAAVLSVRFSRDGKRLVTASNDGTAWMWNADTGQQLSEPLRHRGCVTFAEFSPDGGRIATCSSVDDQVRIWPVVKAPVPAPDWLPRLAEALAGQQVLDNKVGAVVPVSSLYELRQSLKDNTDSDWYSRWARWFFNRPAGWPLIEFDAPAPVQAGPPLPN